MKMAEGYPNGYKTLGKGQIACYEQFLLFPVFSKGLFPRGVKRCRCVGIGYLKTTDNNVSLKHRTEPFVSEAGRK